MAWVYAIRHRETSKAYIGSTGDLRRRWKDHRRSLDRGTHFCKPLQSDWARDGATAFVWEIVETCDMQEMTARERECLLGLRGCYYNRYNDPRTQWHNLEYRERMVRRAKERASSSHGKKLMKTMRAKRADYSMMSHVRNFRKPGNQFRLWTPEEETILRENFGKRSAKELAAQLNRPYQAVLVRASRLGIKSKGSAAFSERMRQVSIEREKRIANDPEARKKRSEKMSKSAIARFAKESAHVHA